MRNLTPDDEFEAACLSHPSTECRCLILLNKYQEEVKALKAENKDLKKWIQILKKRIEK